MPEKPKVRLSGGRPASRSSPEKEPPADKLSLRSKAKKEKDEKLRKAFAAFDKDGGGTIDKDELRAVLESLGQKPTEAELQEMMSDVDKDGNGTIDFEEFRDLIQKKTAGRKELQRQSSKELQRQSSKGSDSVHQSSKGSDSRVEFQEPAPGASIGDIRQGQIVGFLSLQWVSWE